MGHAIEMPAGQGNLKAHPKLSFEKNGYKYLIERKGGKSTYTVTGAQGELSLPIEWAFGLHMQTFVFAYQGRYYESMVSFYPRLNGLAITLGDEQLQPRNLVEAMGREMPDKETTVCFACHATNAVTRDKLTIESMQPGVTCEHCHVGAAAHLESISRGKSENIPPRLGKMGAEDMNGFCGQCHRTWDFVVRAREWGEVNVRFAPYRLTNSECFLGDDKRIRCTACHDPHQPIERDAATYDNACLACHATQPRKSCPVSKKDCVSCHMPKVKLSEGHAEFTDHQIRIVRPGEPYPN